MKDRLFFSILIIILVALPLTSFLIWYVQPEKPLNMLVLNKTVPLPNRSGHRSLFWILRNEKYVKSNNKLYNNDVDYFGFFPKKPYRDKQYAIKRIRLDNIDSLSNACDAIYYVDAYGVYFNEWYQGKPYEKIVKIDGGLNQNDYLLMKEMVSKSKLVIAEFNILASPTNPLVSVKTQQLLRIGWHGWTGRYFDRLDTLNNNELPAWIVRDYIKENHHWEFTKSGLVFIKDNENIVVLENESDLDYAIPLIHSSSEYQNIYGIPENIKYPFWFEITFPKSDQQVVSSFEILANKKGLQTMEKYGIPKSFPAVIADSLHHIYYFTGDFAESRVNMWTASMGGIKKLENFMHQDSPSDSKTFFWRYYRPLMSKILKQYSTSK